MLFNLFKIVENGSLFFASYFACTRSLSMSYLHMPVHAFSRRSLFRIILVSSAFAALFSSAFAASSASSSAVFSDVVDCSLLSVAGMVSVLAKSVSCVVRSSAPKYPPPVLSGIFSKASVRLSTVSSSSRSVSCSMVCDSYSAADTVSGTEPNTMLILRSIGNTLLNSFRFNILWFPFL